MTATLPAATAIGSATLRIADEKRALALYRDVLGLKVADHGNGLVALGAGGEPFLFSRFHPAPSRARGAGLQGCFMSRFLLPDRPALGSAIARLANADIRLGASDHNVSEAIYLYDADGNGLEIYRDRPREEWPWQGGLIRMANAPLDFEGILAEGGKEEPDEHMPMGTRIGHVHLQVGDLEEAKTFYTGILGFEKTASLPGALFASAGGYHHHIAVNVWDSRNAPPPPANMAGLTELAIEVPETGIAAVKRRIEEAGVKTASEGNGFIVHDPWRTKIRMAPMRAKG